MTLFEFIVAGAIIWVLALLTIWFALGAFDQMLFNKGKSIGAGATKNELADISAQMMYLSTTTEAERIENAKTFFGKDDA